MYKIPKFHPKKMAKRRRKLRSLVPREYAKPKAKNPIQLLIFAALVLSGVILAIYYNGTTTIVWSEFLTTYRNQYNLIAHGGKDYCLPVMDTGKLFAEIGTKVINQDTALSTIEQEFRNNSKFTAIAIVGTTGVGKSLFAQALIEHFPWQENTQAYSWSRYYTRNQKKEDVLMFLNYLSDCGRNLIIIDNLGPEDVDLVQEYNKYSLKHVEQGTTKLIVIYVFNLVSYTDEQREQYNDKMRALQELQNVKIVTFRKFDSQDLKNCIRHEAKYLNITLDEDDFYEIYKSIDAERSGCKNVHSKVLMYGEI